MKISKLDLDERGSSWKTLELTWNELSEIEEAVKYVEALPKGFGHELDEIIIKIGTHMTVKRTQDGIIVAFEDHELKPIDDPVFSYKRSAEVPARTLEESTKIAVEKNLSLHPTLEEREKGWKERLKAQRSKEIANLLNGKRNETIQESMKEQAESINEYTGGEYMGNPPESEDD